MLCLTNNSIKHQSFAYTLLNNQKVLYLTIRFSISHLFAQFECQRVLFDPLIGPYQVQPLRGQSEPGSDGNEEVLRIPQSSSNVISRTLVVEVLPSAEKQWVYSTAPADRAKHDSSLNRIYCSRIIRLSETHVLGVTSYVRYKRGLINYLHTQDLYFVYGVTPY